MCVAHAFMQTLLPMLLLWPGLCYLLCCSMLASMAWTLWSFYGLENAFAYACFYNTSMGHYTWYLVPTQKASQRSIWTLLVLYKQNVGHASLDDAFARNLL
jgi:hypothetical protein